MKAFENRIVHILFAALITLGLSFPGHAVETFVLKGKVVSNDEKGVEGAQIYLYNSPNIWRKADYVTSKSGKDGRFSIVLPRSRYWAVARLDTDCKGQNSIKGEKHSGAPTMLEPTTGKETETEFVIADFSEAGRKKQKIREEFTKLHGRVTDQGGVPVPHSYVFAYQGKEPTGLPEFISAWTDDTGEYVLYVPSGRYFLGAATRFPPEKTLSNFKEVSVEAGKLDIAISIELTIK